MHTAKTGLYWLVYQGLKNSGADPVLRYIASSDKISSLHRNGNLIELLALILGKRSHTLIHTIELATIYSILQQIKNRKSSHSR